MRPHRPSALHLIENHGRIRTVDEAAGEHESGYWKIADRTATELVGADIYFHRKQSEPSYFGGRILGFRKQTDGEYSGRIVFRFRASPEHEGRKTTADGWGREKKFVRERG